MEQTRANHIYILFNFITLELDYTGTHLENFEK